MFSTELSYLEERRSQGCKQALDYFADINDNTSLHGIVEECDKKNVNINRKGKYEKIKSPEPSLFLSRVLLDFNENFIEMSNQGDEKRSLGFMLFLIIAAPLFFVGLATISDLINYEAFSANWKIAAIAGGGITLCAAGLFSFFWKHLFSAVFFTALRPRYRFNRISRKVYVLRPKKFGGNNVLDWERARAHVNWAPPKSWTPEQLAGSQEARHARHMSAAIEGNLLIYWPPFDLADPARRGEDLIWVGPDGSGEPLWKYIRKFMEEGMDAVPPPTDYNWLRKGFSTPSQHMRETVMHGSLLSDQMTGQELSGATAVNFGLNVLWAPLHSLAERLCYWPTFPAEWNSDCGQRRRESGIGPEEPLKWTPRH